MRRRHRRMRPAREDRGRNRPPPGVKRLVAWLQENSARYEVAAPPSRWWTLASMCRRHQRERVAVSQTGATAAQRAASLLATIHEKWGHPTPRAGAPPLPTPYVHGPDALIGLSTIFGRIHGSHAPSNPRTNRHTGLLHQRGLTASALTAPRHQRERAVVLETGATAAHRAASLLATIFGEWGHPTPRAGASPLPTP
jgi:hypothetical protein